MTAPTTRRLTQEILADPGLPAQIVVQPVFEPWSPAILTSPTASNPIVQASYWGPWSRVTELRRRQAIKILRR